MVPRSLIATLQAAWVAGMASGWYRFQRAARDPERAQRSRLRHLLQLLGPSAYGRAHGLERITDVRAFQRAAPVVTWEEVAPHVDRIVAGETDVLTTSPVTMLERTGGSTAANKLVPYTETLRAEFSAATSAWLFDLHRGLPELFGTRSYWSISPATRRRETTAGGLPIGFEDDTEYFGPVERWALGHLLAMPSDVARLPTMTAWRRTTLHRLLGCEDLGLISVWSPTFLTRLMEALPPQLDALLEKLPPARRDQIQRGLDRVGAVTGEALWPRLRLVSCWTDGASAGFLPALRRWFPRVHVQPKGLLATEGVISTPLWGQDGAALAVTSHFLEFEELDAPGAPPRLAHELRVGGHYAPLMTTAGGLVRYRIGDVVRCVGHHRALPLVRYAGRLDRVSDLCGEKLHARRVEDALAQARTDSGVTPAFALLAPQTTEPPRYVLYVESAADDEALSRFGAALEAQLGEGHHYRYARDLGQLGPLVVHRVTRGWARFERQLVSEGARAGDIKPTGLDTRDCWPAIFGLV